MWNMQPLICTGVNTKLSCVLRRKRTGYLPWGKYSSSENTEWSSRKCCRENYWLCTAGSVGVEPSKRGYAADQLSWYQFTKLYDARRWTLSFNDTYQSDVLPMLRYCRSFGDCEKESAKRLSTWSAFYFSHPRSWYLLPEGTIQFQEMPLMNPFLLVSCA